MAMDFKKWLKEQRNKDYVFFSFFKDSNFVFENPKTKPDDVVEVRALGEWAWQRFTERYNLALEINNGVTMCVRCHMDFHILQRIMKVRLCPFCKDKEKPIEEDGKQYICSVCDYRIEKKPNSEQHEK